MTLGHPKDGRWLKQFRSSFQVSSAIISSKSLRLHDETWWTTIKVVGFQRFSPWSMNYFQPKPCRCGPVRAAMRNMHRDRSGNDGNAVASLKGNFTLSDVGGVKEIQMKYMGQWAFLGWWSYESYGGFYIKFYIWSFWGWAKIANQLDLARWLKRRRVPCRLRFST